MKCLICGYESEEVFRAQVLNKYDVSYYLCGNCGFHFTENPYWIQEAYSSVINVRDYGIMARNLTNLKYIVSYLFMNKDFWREKIYQRKYKIRDDVNLVDYGGGHGILTRLLRDAGVNAWWSDKFAENLFAVGFEAEKREYKYLTLFEVMEHVSDPVAEIKNAVNLYNPETIIFSTTLYGGKGALPKRDWWYYIFDMGQHISFYCVDSLRYLSNSLGYEFYTNGKDYHCLSRNSKFSKIIKTPTSLILKMYRSNEKKIESLLRYDEEYIRHYLEKRKQLIADSGVKVNE